MRRTVGRWGRTPAVHFVALGALLFALAAGRDRPAAAPPARAPVVLTAADVARLGAEYAQRTGLAPSPADQAALVETAVAEEVLYREALLLGLDRGDGKIRHRLVQKMEAVADDPAAGAERLYRDARALGLDRDDVVLRRMLVHKMRRLAELEADRAPLGDDVLRRHLARHAERWRRPPCVAFSHVFLDAARHGARLAREAGALRARLAADPEAAADAARLSDPFPLGRERGCLAPAELAALLGVEAAAAVMRLAPGTWSAPIASVHGLHLVRVDRADPGGPPRLDEVRAQVALAVRAERRARALAKYLRRLRALYQVRVEPGGAAS